MIFGGGAGWVNDVTAREVAFKPFFTSVENGVQARFFGAFAGGAWGHRGAMLGPSWGQSYQDGGVFSTADGGTWGG